MKLLVCVDGSENGKKALEKAAVIAGGSFVEEVAVINVYDGKMDLSASPWGSMEYSVTEEDVRRLKKLNEEQKEKRQAILEDALKHFEGKDVKLQSILEDGPPAHTIVSVAAEQGYDVIVIGSRGHGSLKKLLLGSVSNAVAQEAKNCCVLLVK